MYDAISTHEHNVRNTISLFLLLVRARARSSSVDRTVAYFIHIIFVWTNKSPFVIFNVFKTKDKLTDYLCEWLFVNEIQMKHGERGAKTALFSCALYYFHPEKNNVLFIVFMCLVRLILIDNSFKCFFI